MDVYLFPSILKGLKYEIIYDFTISYKYNTFIKIVSLLKYLKTVLNNITRIFILMKLVHPLKDFKCCKCILISSNSRINA